MNITTKIIITDTNIITDLNNANILDKFVELDNVYISDMVKCDEINSSTGNADIIKKFKTINATTDQIGEIFKISNQTSGLSPYDIVNYIIAKANDAILATGDRKLKFFAESNNIEVIRTLKIIKLMNEKGILSIDEAVNACVLLKKNIHTRIPVEDIDELILVLKKDSVTC